MNHKIKMIESINLKIICLVFIITSTMSIIVFISTPIVVGQNDFSTYTDIQGRFSVGYPSDWQVHLPSSGESKPILSFDSDHGTNFNIVTLPIGVNKDPSLLLNSFAIGGSQREFENPVIDRSIECSNYTVGGQKACSIIIEGSTSGTPIKILFVNSVVNGLGYFITFFDHANNFNFDLPTFERIVSSFQFSHSSQSAPSIGSGATDNF